MSSDLIPDSHIIIHEPLRPDEQHDASEIRPGQNSATKLEISYLPGYKPFVQIFLDQPDVRNVRLIGNVKTADIKYTVTDGNGQWTEVPNVDMTLPWPMEPMSIGIIKIIPLEATSEEDEYFHFTVEITTCDHNEEEEGRANNWKERRLTELSLCQLCLQRQQDWLYGDFQFSVNKMSDKLAISSADIFLWLSIRSKRFRIIYARKYISECH